MKYQIRRNLPKSMGGYTEGQIVTLSDDEAQALLVKGLARSVEIKGVPKKPKREIKPATGTVAQAEQTFTAYRNQARSVTEPTSSEGEMTDG